MSTLDEKVRDLQTRPSTTDEESKETPRTPKTHGSTNMPDELFRRDAVQNAAKRIDGAIVPTTPMSVKTVGIFLSLTVFACVTFAAVTTYARKTTVTGYLVPDQGMIRATSQAPGTLHTLFVHENQVVAAGDHIAVLSLSPQTDVGNVGELVSKGSQSEALAAQTKAQSQLAQLEVERDQANSKLVNMQAELQQLLMQTVLQEQRLEVAVTQLERGAELTQKGYLPLRELETRRLAAITAEQEVAGLRRQKNSH
jgi:membrane fusion protein